jgi:hypothetical protein
MTVKTILGTKVAGVVVMVMVMGFVVAMRIMLVGHIIVALKDRLCAPKNVTQ